METRSAAKVAAWNDVNRPPEERVRALIEQMTLREKVAQLYGLWVGASAGEHDVAPSQHELVDDLDLDAELAHGLGQLTRPFGTAPVDAGVGAALLARTQRRLMRAGRFGLPAIAHEECLAGFTAHGATAYPIPLSWGATFEPALVQEMGRRIGASLRAVGAHQGLAPVLDVVRDPRWGRVEETIGEDPYLVGSVGSAYVRGLQESGVIATLKHLAGYGASRGARNMAPVSLGPREFADVLLAPFEMAVCEAGAGSVMPAYIDRDGIPASADPTLLTELLRERWGFDGTVVADYFAVSFLRLQHGLTATFGGAAALALSAGLDVELPSVKCFGEDLVAEVRAGRVSEELVDRALRRVLLQKLALGMLDPDYSPLPPGLREEDLEDPDALRGRIDLDPPEDRALARAIAEESIVVAANAGTLPLAPEALEGARVLVVGPTADDPLTQLGCYSFPSHVGVEHPEVTDGIAIPTILDALRAEYPRTRIEHLPGVSVDGADGAGIAPAVEAARRADHVIVCLGDRAGLFGRGTSGEGCDASDMRLPGRQAELMEALLDSGTPVVVVAVEGRPYALGSAPHRAAAVVISFLPGEEGAAAIAGVLSGRVEPAGRLPVSVPASAGGQPWTYLTPVLGERNGGSRIDPTPAFAFGHGLSYTTFEWGELAVSGCGSAEAATASVDGAMASVDGAMASVPTDGAFALSLMVANRGVRAGAEVVQLYLHDPVATVVRPVNRLIAFAKLRLDPGERARVSFRVPADVSSFTGVDGRRRVEPGLLELRLGASSRDIRLRAPVALTGEPRIVDHTRALHCDVDLSTGGTR
ncbi:MAG TPA: glycoside hydrolase family 3 N-terminal domain-containing protein [Solirubrobacteraceae bacterium]|nr:glycoside hydrolase family 3 N-terminal domain-containing protein [Solirubrobacteraceae bacterium]